jgi:uncharacterized membrane protein YgaE (UPF0421/DUF939 family)
MPAAHMPGQAGNDGVVVGAVVFAIVFVILIGNVIIVFIVNVAFCPPTYVHLALVHLSNRLRSRDLIASHYQTNEESHKQTQTAEVSFL